MSVESTIISVHSQVWREMRRHSCRKYRSVWSILGARCRTGVGPGFGMPSVRAAPTRHKAHRRQRRLEQQECGIRLPTLLQS